MPLMYPPTIHGVEKVTANFRGQMGSSLAIDLHFGDGADTVTQAVFFPPHAEDEARRVVAALNGDAASPDAELREAARALRDAQKTYHHSRTAADMMAVNAAMRALDELL